ncbi:protein TIC 40, chloroplastic-like isoform X2 [Primulina eburnea]|uniref:protein TIC 40, chloroplastic-like isoform X2 n=1 Tax=Primulina eburnea TaxID=1245227 RepID=UPI003C6C573F
MDNLSLVSYHKIGLGLSPNPRKPLFFHKSTDGLANSSQKTGKNAGQAKSWSSLSAVSLFQGTKATKIIGESCAGLLCEHYFFKCPTNIIGWCKSTDFSAAASLSSGVTSLLDWCWCWFISTFFMAGWKNKAFVDVYPEETFRKNAFESYRESVQTNSHNDPQASQSDSLKGMSSKQGTGASKVPFTGNANSLLSVEALEKMMEDPTAQKMIFPYLPEEMRNPATFKWMLQNPQYRQQLQDMLNNMGGSPEWDNRMAESLKSFDLNSPEIKQQFDEIGLTPEEAITKIMANPDVAMAFQNPRVQAAITECSQNPLNIAKYQNDKEVMDVFNKIAELFPGVAGSS